MANNKNVMMLHKPVDSSSCSHCGKPGTTTSSPPAPTSSTHFTSLCTSIKIRHFTLAVCCLPLFGLLICFVIAIFYQHDQVNETVCKVKNVVPSISAITSTIPNRYVWRVAIALHSTPMLYLGRVYYNYHRSVSWRVAQPWLNTYLTLTNINLLACYLENVGLLGTTYISNREDYPVHEKLFILYMVTTIGYMITSCAMFTLANYHHGDKMQQLSLRLKYLFFVILIVSTVGLLFFFYRHRVHCEEGAFSWFSVCEYWIAITNIAFHFTTYLDFSDYEISFIHPGQKLKMS